MSTFDKLLFTVVGALIFLELFRLAAGKSNVYVKIYEWFFKKKKK